LSKIEFFNKIRNYDQKSKLWLKSKKNKFQSNNKMMVKKRFFSAIEFSIKNLNIFQKSNFFQKPKFQSKIEIFRKVCPIIEFFVKNRNLCQKWNFLSKIEILMKCCSKIEILMNFCWKISKIQNFLPLIFTLLFPRF